MSSLTRRVVRDPGLTAAGLRTSGVVGAVGLGFLVAMFAAFAAGARSAGMTLGWVNDVSGVVTLPLAMPGMLALHARLRPHLGRYGDGLLVLGVGSASAIAVLQLLLVTGALTFDEEVGPVLLAYVGLGTWLVLSGRAAERLGVVPGGARLGALAAAYVGYPLWAFRIARTLEED